MRRTFARLTITAAATAGLAATAAVQALGLGEIDVNSNLNQRFTASIPLTEISAEDLETVTVSLAPNEAFERAGIERSEYLSTLDFEIKNDRGRPRVVVTSSQIAREPVLDLLVQARWSGGKILRDYTVLLDPVETAVAARPATPAPAVAPPRAAPAPMPRPAPAPVVAAPAPAKPSVPVGSEFYEVPAETKAPKKAPAPAGAPVASDAAFDSATSSYGPVAPKETLWSIATKVRPSPAVSVDQVLLALAEANPVAIQRGTTVSKGATLRVPSAERIQAVAPAQAKARLAALRGESAAPVKPAVVQSKPASAAAPLPAPTAATPTPTAAVPVPSAPAAAPAPVKPSTRPELPKPQLALPPGSAPTPAAATAPAAVASPTGPATTAASASAPIVAAPNVGGTAVAAAAAPAASPATPPATTDAAATATAAAAAPAAAAPAAAPATPAPETVTAPTPAAVPAKSPLAQPLAEEEAPGALDGLGLPLSVAGLVLLLGGAAFALSRRRKAAAASPQYAGFKPGDTSTVQAPLGGAGATSKLGDTTRISDTQTLPARNLGTGAAAMESTLQMTVPPTANLTTQPVAAHESTLILDPEAVATLNNAVKQSAVTSGSESFDKTTQVQVDTLHINLGDNDPLSEADFHLAYGLYDEAILLLKSATAQQPARTDLKVKLAETYFAAGRPLEFQELAEELKGSLSAAEWSKLAIMGSQICPDVAMFQSAEGEGALDADFDLAFDDGDAGPAAAPAAPIQTPGAGSIDFALDFPEPVAAPAPTPAPSYSSNPAAMVMDERRMDLSADFDLDDDAPGGSKAAIPPAGMDDEASIDFMLGQSLTPLGAGLKIPEPKDLNFNLGSAALNFDVPPLELASPPSHSSSMANMNDRPTLVPPTDSLSFSLQDLEVSITPRQSAAETADDELNTKLDLARAYVEMGDNDMARSLLQEVQQQGNERHQQEAASLLQRLPA